MELSDAALKSEKLLAEIKRPNRVKDIVDVEIERTKVVIVTIGGNRFAFNGNDIREILPACEISWVPGLPDFLPGLIIIRGEIESVIDIRQFWGNEINSGQPGQIVLAVHGEFRSGILIDSIEDVVDVPLSAIISTLTTLTGTARDLLSGELDWGGIVIPLLDIEKLADKVTL